MFREGYKTRSNTVNFLLNIFSQILKNISEFSEIQIIMPPVSNLFPLSFWVDKLSTALGSATL